jgi:glucose-1-phosphate thymidylyltransferase
MALKNKKGYNPVNMKAVILAGGSATRLRPLTVVTNKHLLPVYDKPVIYYTIEKLVRAGISRIMIVTSPHHIQDFVSLLGSGQNFKIKSGNKQIQIVYAIQNEPKGIAQGLYIAKDYIGNDDCILCLGDNIIEDDIDEHIRNFRGGASIFLKKVDDPERFGIATVDKSGRVLSVEEKPKKPKSDLAIVGMYIYDNTVFEKMAGQPTSARGELEITYLNNKFLEEGKLRAAVLKKEWFDIGTFDSLLQAGNFMKKKHGSSRKK